VASRTPHTGVALEVLTAANLAKYPKGLIGYASTTSTQSSITSEVDLTALTVTVTTGASRILKIIPRVLFDIDNTGAANISAYVYEDGVVLGQFCRGKGLQNSELMGPMQAFTVNPSAGSHTYKLTAERTSGTGVVTTIATATNPNFLLVEDVGPSF
jgi:hypothetical protein